MESFRGASISLDAAVNCLWAASKDIESTGKVNRCQELSFGCSGYPFWECVYKEMNSIPKVGQAVSVLLWAACKSWIRPRERRTQTPTASPSLNVHDVERLS